MSWRRAGNGPQKAVGGLAGYGWQCFSYRLWLQGNPADIFIFYRLRRFRWAKLMRERWNLIWNRSRSRIWRTGYDSDRIYIMEAGAKKMEVFLHIFIRPI